MDGGRILKTTKTSYAEHVGADGYADKVRGIMKQQHKAMFIALRDGDFDVLIGAPIPGAKPAPEAEAGRSSPVPPDPTARPTEAVARPPSVVPPPVPPASVRPAAPASPSVRPAAAPSVRPPSPVRPPSEPHEVDFAALERAAFAASEDHGDSGRISSPGSAVSALPPPPSNMLVRQGGQGSYREVASAETRRSRPPPDPGRSRTSERPPSTRKSGKPPPIVQTRPSRPPPSGRYAVSQRPQPLAGASRPPEGRSIFGEELISEKSLDEVILSYLAEDLDASPKK